jgi:cardiolipin synthase A/B
MQESGMSNWLPVLIALAATAWALFGLWAAGHALLYKRDPRSALGWLAVCLLMPYVGPLIYVLFGINRIGRHANQAGRFPASAYSRAPSGDQLETELSSRDDHFIRISSQVAHRPMVEGNQVETYFKGEDAYAEMLAAIQRAEQRVYLASYIFKTDKTGKQFIKVLQDATERGVEVRVLIDGAGELYSLPRVTRLLERAGVRQARFIPLRLIPPSLHLNMRNHRKLLIVDGTTSFTGGMNIGDHHIADRHGKTPVVDMHFRLTGPVITQLEQAFTEDWHFATDQHVPVSDTDPAKESSATSTGPAACRVITDGPDDDLGKLGLVMQTAISAAQQSVRIMTPYFLPTTEMIAAIKSASLRGVVVDIILPAKSNLRYVDWATRNLLWEILRWNVNVYYQPPPFAHSKLFIIDEHYAQIGSANIDPRSLRLNFEIAVEVLNDEFALQLSRHCTEVISHSRRVTLQEVDSRSHPIRIRDSIAWLFSPYL